MVESIAPKLIHWFTHQKRDLPWRQNTSPYRVWISEVMLQQTQVKSVIPYYKRWMEAFPNIETLAEANIETVIKLWEGLGYYSRARNLHQGAQQILTEHHGKLPDTLEGLLSIKGIGAYTAAAILNFAYKKKAPLVDGNVKRVMARLFCIPLDFSKPSHEHTLRRQVEQELPDQQYWIFSEALMELGATICLPKKPRCSDCPIQSNCTAHQQKKQLEFPFKRKRSPATPLFRAVLVLVHNDHILLKKADQGLMQDLHEFYTIELNNFSNFSLNHSQIKPFYQKARETHPLKEVQHSFTSFKATLKPYYLELKESITVKGYNWVSRKQFHKLAFSSGHRKILAQIDFF